MYCCLVNSHWVLSQNPVSRLNRVTSGLSPVTGLTTLTWNAAEKKINLLYIISYGGCPIIWASKLQTEVVLSSTESEYVGLSESLRE